MKEAFGGYKYTNGNGVTAIKPPNFEWMKLMLEYGFGKPPQVVEQDDTTKSALESFKQFATDFSLPKTPAVSSSGKIVSTEPPTVVDKVDESVTVN